MDDETLDLLIFEARRLVALHAQGAPSGQIGLAIQQLWFALEAHDSRLVQGVDVIMVDEMHPPTVYTHAAFSVGIGERAGRQLVVAHATLGTRRFEFWYTDDQAETLGTGFSESARKLQNGGPRQ